MNDPSDRQVPVDTLIARAESTKRGLSPFEAGELNKALQAEPSPEGVIAPIMLAHPNSVPPVAYVLHKWSKLCLSCGTQHCYSDIFAENHLKSTWGRFVRNLVPISRPDWNVPLRVVEVAPKTIPFCHECIDLARDYIATLPSPPVPQAVTGSAIQPAGESATGGARPSTPKTPANKKFTLDDLEL